MKEIKNTTFEINVKGKNYEVFNGTYTIEGVWVRDIELDYMFNIKETGTYANRPGVRNSIIRKLEEFDREEEMVVRAEYEAEIMAETMAWEHEAEVEMEMESAQDLEDVLGECEDYPVVADEEAEEENPEQEKDTSDVVDEWLIGYLPKFTLESIRHATYIDKYYVIVVEVNGQRETIEGKNWKDIKKRVSTACKAGK